MNVYRYHFPETTIILANPTLRIYWSGVSILEAGLDCMEQLVKANADWKFFFNAIGTALPGRPIRVHLLMLFPSKVWAKKNRTRSKIGLLKNPQFLSNPYETWSKWLPHETITLSKFHKNWTKIVDFLSMANFWACSVFFCSDFKLNQSH